MGDDDEATFTHMVKLSMQNAGNYIAETLNDSPQCYARAMPRRAFQLYLFLQWYLVTKPTKGLYQSSGEYFLAKPISSEVLIDAISRVLI